MKVQDIIYQICLLVGFKILIQASMTLIGLVYQYAIMKCFSNDLRLRYFAKKPYALVTGASDGIGLSFCKTLAEKYGFNLIMVSRSESKLKAAKEEVLKISKNKVDVVTVV